MSANEQVYEGSCHCGRVRYRAVGPWGFMEHCHCTGCRKSHGAAFATYIQLPRARFTLLQGKDQIRIYEAESGTKRSMCQTCGSCITSHGDSEPGSVYVAAGTLDTPLEQKADAHIFVRSKAPWYEILDDVPQHVTYPDSEG